MVPRETGNNAYAKCWRDKKKSIMVFLILANSSLTGYSRPPSELVPNTLVEPNRFEFQPNVRKLAE